MHYCPICKKQYKRLRNFQEHRAVCEAIVAAKNSNEDKTHLYNIPSQTEMWFTLKYYIKKCDRLEKKMEKLEKWTNKQKKRVSIIDWLNEHYNPKSSCQDWVDHVILQANDLQLVFDHNFINGIYKIFQSRLLLNDQKEHPIKAFDQYLNTLFIYNGSNWVTIDQDEMEKMVVNIHNKLQRQLGVYKRRHEVSINDPSTNHTWYKNVRKVMGGPEPYPASVKKISFKLYNHLKFNLKKVIEYEFTF